MTEHHKIQHHISVSSLQALFRRLKSIVHLYRLNVGPTLGSKMASDAANSATDLQTWQAVNAVVAALEIQGQAAAAASAAGHQRYSLTGGEGGATRSGSPDLIRSRSPTGPLAIGVIEAEAGFNEPDAIVDVGGSPWRSIAEEGDEVRLSSSSPLASSANMDTMDKAWDVPGDLAGTLTSGGGGTQSESTRGATEVPSGSLVGQPHDRPEVVSSELLEGSTGTTPAGRDVSGEALSGSFLQPEDVSRISEDSAGSWRSSGGGADMIGISGGSVGVGGGAVRPVSAQQRKSAGGSRPTSAVKLHSRPNSALVPSMSMARKEGEMPSAAVVLVEGD